MGDDTAVLQIAKVNEARMARAFDPRTCLLQHQSQAVVQNSIQAVAALQRACHFRTATLPELTAEACTDDPTTQHGHSTCAVPARECFGADFARLMRVCPQLCGACGRCRDERAECSDWAAGGSCKANADFMARTCPLACNMCTHAYDHEPPHAVALWNGLFMPTTGFGTAGLGERAAETVSMALKQGVRLLDSAQAPEWYREDLNGQVRSRYRRGLVWSTWYTQAARPGGMCITAAVVHCMYAASCSDRICVFPNDAGLR